MFFWKGEFRVRIRVRVRIEIVSLDLSSFDTGNVTDMSSVFADSSVISLNLSSLNTGRVINMSKMFENMKRLALLDFSSFNTGNVTDMYNMFSESRVLRTIKASSDFVTNKVRYSFVFYKNDSLVGGNGTTYNDSNPKDKTYARIDIPGRPGYFTQGP